MENTRLYRVREFATMAGVTVRTLHHYDRLGLLRPARKLGSSYRVYTDRDLARLEQIVVLKFIGIPLKEMPSLLREDAALGDALMRQNRVLSERRRQLDRAITAIASAANALGSNDAPDWTLVKYIIKEIEMQNDSEWSKKYYSEEAQAKIAERQRTIQWTPEMQEKVTADWNALYADIEAVLHEDPKGPNGQALAARWKELIRGFTGGDPEIQKGLNKLWADKSNWPTAQRERYTVKPEIQAWISDAMRKD